MDDTLHIFHVPPSDLQVNPWNSNYVSPENEAKLRESVKRHGVYKPIICRELADGSLQILGGEHRARVARDLGIERVPVVNLGRISDKKAKEIGLADNGRYGDDDILKLSDILKDIGADEAVTFLPFEDRDLATIFNVAKVDIDDLELPDEKGDDGLDALATTELKSTATHQLMTFKVPLGDAEAVSKLIDQLIKAKGYDKGQDSKAAAGMALVDIVNAARGAL